jgi:tetratricopeptide (TPR) repeat protein
MHNPISIHDVNGNVTVTIVEGNNNQTELSIESFIDKVIKDCGLQLIYEDNYKKDSNTSTNFKDWLDGFSFNIKSIYHGREFRRDDVLDSIKQQLESKGRLLILGESGTSKSIVLMEILCDYLKKGYKIFHNLDLGTGAEVKNLENIENTIIELVNNGNNVIVIVDNIHNKTISNIFTLIKKVRDDYEDKLVKIKFLLAARQPEFGWAMDRGIFDSETVEKIDMLFNSEKKYNLSYFSRKEVKGFLEKYKEYYRSLKRNNSMVEHAQEIFNDTKGHPIMVRFSVLQNGLENHVKKMYTDYLVENKSPNVERIKSVIACSLYDISSIPLTDSELSDKLALRISSLQIMNTMIMKEGNIWTTIHPRWDLELFRYMFLRNKADLEIIKEAFSQVFTKIIDIEIGSHNQIIILDTLYRTIAVGKFVDISLVQEMINLNTLKSKLDQEDKIVFYANILGMSLYHLNDYNKVIEYCDEAIKLNREYSDAHNNKGIALSALGHDEKAIECYDEAIRIDPEYGTGYYNKGNALSALGQKEEAIECYDEAIRIDPQHFDAYYNKGNALSALGQKEEAIECYDEAIRIDPLHADFHNNKGIALSALGHDEKAIECYDEAIRIDPEYGTGYYNKGNALSALGQKEEAIECYDEAIRIDPLHFDAYYNKGNALSALGQKEEAIECYDEAIKINPNYVDAYYGKAFAHSALKQHEQALRSYDEAIKINPNYVDAYYGKGVSLTVIGRNEEAIKCYDDATRANPEYASAYYRKGTVLDALGRKEEAIKCYDEAIRLKPEDFVAYYNKGNALSDLERYKEALECYQRTLDFDNNNIPALLGKAFSLIQLSRKTEAKPLIDKIRSIDPDNELLLELEKSL